MANIVLQVLPLITYDDDNSVQMELGQLA
jgi:hypothetical protein